MTTKIIIKDNVSSKTIVEYDGYLIPMMGDELDLPKLGIVKVIERIFIIGKPEQVILKVKR